MDLRICLVSPCQLTLPLTLKHGKTDSKDHIVLSLHIQLANVHLTLKPKEIDMKQAIMVPGKQRAGMPLQTNRKVRII